MPERKRNFAPPLPHGTAFGDQSDLVENQFRQRSCAPLPHQSEPSLGDMLADPIVQRLMERDGVRMTALLLLIAETRLRLR